MLINIKIKNRFLFQEARLIKKTTNTDTGFTLLELLIVIGVIAILSAIIIPSFLGMRTEGEITAARGDLKTLAFAVENYYLHHDHQYPTYITDLLTAQPRMIKDDIPEDPFNKSSIYRYSNLNEYYLVWTNGPNKEQDITIDVDNEKVLVPKTSDDIFETNLRAEKQ